MISEISNGRYCEENGYYCPFMDRSGICIATNCKHMIDILEQMEVDRLSQYADEMAEGKLWLEGDRIYRDIEEDWIYDIEGSWGAVHVCAEED